MPTLPNGLRPVISNYGMDDPGGVLRTEVAGGAARYGLDWDRGPQRFTITLILDALQMSIWSAFYHHVIRKGAITFDMRIDSGFGLSPHAVNIMPDSYSIARTSIAMWVASFVVEAENQAYQMTALDAANMIALYNAHGAHTNAFLDRLAQFALYDTRALP